MTYREELEQKAKQSFELFMICINDYSHLYTETEEDEDNNTIIEVIYFDNDDEEFIGRFYFDENGKFLGTD